jgi:hypothetical protein
MNMWIEIRHDEIMYGMDDAIEERKEDATVPYCTLYCTHLSNNCTVRI